MNTAEPLATSRRPPTASPRPNDTCWCGSGDKYKRCHKEADTVFFREERKSLELNRIKPAAVSPKRSVPPEIARPDYAETGIPNRDNARDVRTPEELVRMRRACAAAAKVLRLTSEQVKPGVTTDDLDAYAHELMIKLGGYPSTLNYRGFPKSMCTSVNEVICHGIPDGRPLREGDIVNLDVTIFLDGMHGDTNATIGVGTIDDESKRLIRVTQECLMKGIGAVKAGRPINDIGSAIELHATTEALSVVRSYCGHGINSIFHTALQIPHYFDPKANTLMQVGMTFTIEPMINQGTWEEAHWNDGWTVVTKDLRRSAQFEHTIVVTEQGAEILTLESER